MTTQLIKVFNPWRLLVLISVLSLSTAMTVLLLFYEFPSGKHKSSKLWTPCPQTGSLLMKGTSTLRKELDNDASKFEEEDIHYQKTFNSKDNIASLNPMDKAGAFSIRSVFISNLQMNISKQVLELEGSLKSGCVQHRKIFKKNKEG